MSTKEKKDGMSLMGDIYYKKGGPAYLASHERLYQEAKKTLPSITRQTVQSFLDKQYVHSRHLKKKRNFPRRKVLVLRVNEIWAADLIQIDTLSSFNFGYCFIVTVIDLFSRKLFSRGIKKKTKDETEQAMRDIVKENGNRSPFKLWTDRGKEWLSLTDFYDEMEIVRYSTNSSLKSVFIEIQITSKPKKKR